MKMLRKIIDCESFENSQENGSYGVCFSKVANLLCTVCISTINKLHKRFFLENVPKTSCFIREHFGEVHCVAAF